MENNFVHNQRDFKVFSSSFNIMELAKNRQTIEIFEPMVGKLSLGLISLIGF